MLMHRIACKFALLGACSILIVACNVEGRKKNNIDSSSIVNPNSVRGCATQIKPDFKIKLDLIQQLIDKGSLFAALAHLDALRSNEPQAIYLRAEILRRTERADQASTLYQSLLLTCKSGKGYHGLGLIAGRNHDISLALNYLEKATYELPLDVRVRNDYGYALLLNEQYDMARNEFMTAYELSGGDRLAKTNLALLMFVTEKEDQVSSFIDGMGLDEETVQQLQAEAKRIKPVRMVEEFKPNQVGNFRPVFANEIKQVVAEEIPSNQTVQAGAAQTVTINPVFQEEIQPVFAEVPEPAHADEFKPQQAERGQPAFAEEIQPSFVERPTTAKIGESIPVLDEKVQSTVMQKPKAAVVEEKPVQAKSVQPAFAEEIKPTLIEEPKAAQIEEIKPAQSQSVQPTFAEEIKPAFVEEDESVQINEFKPAHAESIDPALDNVDKPTKSVNESSLNKPE